MRVSIENTSNLNLIDILSDGVSECLIVDNEINSITFRTDRIFYKFLKDNLKTITPFFSEIDNISTESILIEKVKSEILIYFSPGLYSVEITELNINNIEIAQNNLNLNSTFTEQDVLFFTKNYIDTELVNGYKNKILHSDIKPKIIIAGTEYFENLNQKNIENYGSDYTKFIIDGHHKLLAYEELKINPQVVSITKFNDLSERKDDFLDEYSKILNYNELYHYKKSLWKRNFR